MPVILRLDNLTKFYHAGQKVSGFADIADIEPKDVRKITIVLEGYSCTKWNSHYETFSKHLLHMRLKRVVLNKRRKRMAFDPKRRSFRFQFALPINSPSSFEGKYGYTRYILQAHMFIMYKADSETTSDGITVMSILNLNDISWAKRRMSVEVGKHLGFLQCLRGPIIASLKCPKSGFVAGEIATFTICAENYTGRPVTDVVFAITRAEKFSTNDPFRGMRSNDHVVKIIHFGPIRPISNRMIQASVQFPLLVPNAMRSCKIIDIEYFVSVTFKITGCHKDVKISKGIVIGTIPLIETTNGDEVAVL